ncbi:replication initiator protein A [Roseivivax sp. CAU 1761]
MLSEQNQPQSKGRGGAKPQANSLPAQMTMSLFGADAATDNPNQDLDVGNNPILMVHKFFALSEKEVDFLTTVPHGNAHVSLRVEGRSKYGPATQNDKPFLMFLLTKMAEMKARGEDFRTVKVTSSEYHKKLGIRSSGRVYKQVRRTIDRLAHTWVYAGVDIEGNGGFGGFNWISKYNVAYTTRMIAGKPKQCMTSFTIQPCDWLVNAVSRGSQIIEYDKAYFDLESQLMQRIYEVVRTDTDREMFRIRMLDLMELTGAETETKTFKKNLKRQILGDGGKAPTLLPRHAIYPYSEAKPDKSCTWADRVLAKKQWFVFVRGGVQTDFLDVPLSDIPEWMPSMDEEDLEALSEAVTIKEGAMDSLK